MISENALKVFGCICYMKQSLRGHVEARSLRCVNLGVNVVLKGWHVLVINGKMTGTLLTSRNVKFYEREFITDEEADKLETILLKNVEDIDDRDYSPSVTESDTEEYYSEEELCDDPPALEMKKAIKNVEKKMKGPIIPKIKGILN